MLVLTCLLRGASSIIPGLWYWFYLVCSVVPDISFQACGIGSNLPAVLCRIYYSRLVVLVTYLLCIAGSIIPGLW